jgi:hypothetical protein
MNHFTGYGAYLLFLALRTHFSNPKYDFFEMRGKIRASKETYYKRKDRSFFEKIAREYTIEELRDFYIANLLEDKHYITDLIDENAKLAYTDYIRRRQSLSYNCANDMARTFDQGIQDSFRICSDRYPVLVILFLHRKINIETMIILNDFIPYVDKFDKYFSDDIVWSRIALKIRKYKPFLKYDKNKIKSILKEIINEGTPR